MSGALPILRGLFLIGYVGGLAVVSLLPPSYPVWLARHDTALHLVAYAGLALLAGAALCPPRRLRWVLLGVAGYGLVVELLQSFVPGRHPSLGDIAANGLGIAIGGGCALAWLRWRVAPRGTEGPGARPIER